ncbi:MAG: DUF1592 domain-containing protein [Pirellulaceae bacterium]|nr:DUF1592 domain-containing protein [Pirellulaceae bacterium]
MSVAFVPDTFFKHALAFAIFCVPQLVFAQPDKNRTPLSWDHTIRGIVEKHCLECHNADESRGDVNLKQDDDIKKILNHRDVWETALAMIESEEMPPRKARELPDELRKQMVEFLHVTLESLDCATIQDPGKPSIRRLNRTEYDNSILDLTGLDLNLAESFAPDESSYGFDNQGEVLSLSPVQVEQYHNAAQTIVKELLNLKKKDRNRYESIFGKLPENESEPAAVAKKAIRQFATRAFRRPVENAFVDRLMKIYSLSQSKQASHEIAMGHMITAVLISPRFLIRIENNRPDTEDAYPVDDYELASRLSFFLWSRPPDKTLLELAAAKKLSKLDVLESQTRRMLADKRSMALVDNFFGQWLSIREIESHQPDSNRFPEFSERLRSAMIGEIQGFLSELIRKDRPITDLLDADYTFVNELLAKHYGIQGVKGQKIQRVSLKDRRRGGLLTSAALLMLQSDPGRTNVPRRGNFIAGRILGSSPPPPPPDVPELEAIASDDKPRSLREMLELHRKNPECANCHAKMDPLGFALENYDAIGRWRTKDGKFSIDPSGELASGHIFSGPVELKDLLLEQKDAFTRTLTKYLLIYALGRGLQGNDECVLRASIKAAEENEYRFSSLVIEIVKSYPFRYRQNPYD